MHVGYCGGKRAGRTERKQGLRTYQCKSCGGEIVADENTAASVCPFCGNPVVMTGKLSGALRPDLIIPFKLDKQAAKAGLMKHLEGKKLLPKIFKDQNHIDEIRGIYVPFWLFDTEADANIRYRGNQRHGSGATASMTIQRRSFYHDQPGRNHWI